MLPFGVTIPSTVPQRSEIPEELTNYPVYITNKPKFNAVIPQLNTSTQPLASNTPTYDSLQITATHNKAVFDGKLERPMAVSYPQFLQVTATGNNLYIKRRFHLCCRRNSSTCLIKNPPEDGHWLAETC